MVRYRVIQSFSQTISQISCGHEIMSNPITYLDVSQSKDDDLVDDILNFFFNYYPTLAKNFQNHRPMRIHKMFAPPIKSDWSLIDHLQPSYILHHIQNTPYKDQRIKLDNEPKYESRYTRYHDDLRSKDHLHNSH